MRPPKLIATGTVVLFLAACGVQSSNLDPNAAVTISGKAVGADGKPLANSRVVFVKEFDLGELIGGLFVTAVSLGLACLSDQPPAICKQDAHIATTDSAGSFSFSTTAAQTQGTFGQASTMEVMVRGGVDAAAPTTMAEFVVQNTSLTLPDLRIWQPQVSWAQDRRPVWDSLPASYGGSPVYTVEFYDQRANQWWVTGPTHSGVRVDGRVLEDLRGKFDVAARAHGTANGTTVDYTYTSGSAPVQGYMGPPPSRGAACAPFTSSGVGSFGSCPLTSGAVANGTNLIGAPTGVVIDLGHPANVSLAVIRGCSGQCRIDTSSDLVTWTAAGRVAGPYATISVSSGGLVRYVRVTTDVVTALRQVSTW